MPRRTSRGVRFEFDHAGMEELLTSAMIRGALDRAAEEVAAQAEKDPAVQRNNIEVLIRPFEARMRGYRRSATSVNLDGFKGLPVEAKHGVLARAVTENGLDLKPSGP